MKGEGKCEVLRSYCGGTAVFCRTELQQDPSQHLIYSAGPILLWEHKGALFHEEIWFFRSIPKIKLLTIKDFVAKEKKMPETQTGVLRKGIWRKSCSNPSVLLSTKPWGPESLFHPAPVPLTSRVGRQVPATCEDITKGERALCTRFSLQIDETQFVTWH